MRVSACGQAFVALWVMKLPPLARRCTGRFKVVRANVQSGVVHDFAVNRGPKDGPARKSAAADSNDPSQSVRSIGGGALRR